mmetsp:Transcript_30308/g.45202  ORF Transcript_30308/g.45202 Transcript_30308/m.45202 type:complete len:291 (+) Transcript_30308:329-1201(+)
MMMGLVLFVCNVNISIEGSGSFQESSGCILQSLLDEVVGKRLTETQVIDNVGDVGHVSGKVVTTRLSLDVKVARCTIDKEKTGNLTSRVLFLCPGGLVLMTGGRESSGVVLMFFCLNCSIGCDLLDLLRLQISMFMSLMLLLHLGNKMSKFHHSSVSIVHTLLLSIHKEFQRRVRTDSLIQTKIMMIHTINLSNQHGQFHFKRLIVIFIRVFVYIRLILHAIFSSLVHDLGKSLPRGCQVPTMTAPIGKKVDKDIFILLQCNVKGMLIKTYGILTIGMKFLNCLLNSRIE